MNTVSLYACCYMSQVRLPSCVCTRQRAGARRSCGRRCGPPLTAAHVLSARRPLSHPLAAACRDTTLHLACANGHSTPSAPHVPVGTVAIHAPCSAQIPVLPYLTTSLGANMEEYGYVMTVMAIVQVFGGLLSGAPAARAAAPRIAAM